MVILVSKHLKHCYTNDDGNTIYNLIHNDLLNNRHVVVSFKDMDSVSSSFVNSAFIALLDDISVRSIRKNLLFINSTKQINQMIKKSFDFEEKGRNNLIEA